MITVTGIAPASDEHQSLRLDGVPFDYQMKLTLTDPSGGQQVLTAADAHHEDEGVVFLSAVLPIAGPWGLQVGNETAEFQVR